MTYNGASGFAPYASYVATPTLNNGMEVVSTAPAAPATNWNVLALKATGKSYRHRRDHHRQRRPDQLGRPQHDLRPVELQRPGRRDLPGWRPDA